jgi:AraC-like DNA-binding protein
LIRKSHAHGRGEALFSDPMNRLGTRGLLRSGIFAALWILSGVLVGCLLGERRTDLWPPSRRAISFADSADGGISRARVDTSGGVLTLVSRLDTGARYPVAGGILFLEKDSEAVDLSRGSLELDLGTSSLPALRLCLIEDLPGFTRDEEWQTARSECADRELLPGTSKYVIPVEEFVTPAWWYAKSGLHRSQIGPEKRSRIVRLVFQGTDGVPLRQEYDLRIQAIRLRSFRPFPFATALLCGLIAALLQLGIALRRRPSLPLAKETEHREEIAFQPIEAVSYADREREAVVDIIAKGYSDPELSLEKVAHAAGVPVDRVTAHIKVASGLLFKGYLNRVRGEAARKLLLETDLPIAEVAQRVGYANIPHFNRVFKELFDTTPTAIRGGSQIAE